MLILVAVTVSIAVNSGLFGHASKAAKKWDESEGTEKQIANGEVKFKVGNTNYNSIDEYLAENPSGGGTPGGGGTDPTPVVHEGVTIPGGFIVSGIPEEQHVDTGLVIYEIPAGTDPTAEDFWSKKVTPTDGGDEYPEVHGKYNQFVWVPVEKPYVTVAELTTIINNSAGAITDETKALQSLADGGIYPMAVKISDTDYRGVLYDFSAGEDGKVKITVKEFSSEANYDDGSVVYEREPAILSSNEPDYVD